MDPVLIPALEMLLEAVANPDGTPESQKITIAQIASLANALSVPKTLEVNIQTGTTYTLVAADSGKVITCDNASDVTLTVPSLGTGFNCTIIQLGAGQVIPTASGTTLNNRQAHTKTAGQYATITLMAHVANTFIWQGDTA